MNNGYSQTLTYSPGGAYSSQFGPFTLRSAYQPIVSLPHRRVVGFEALLRNGEGDDVQGPLPVFQWAVRQMDGLPKLDNASRLLHLVNYPFVRYLDHWLFINVSQATIVLHPEQPLLPEEYPARDWFDPRQVVLEIMEEAVQDKDRLQTFVATQREQGFLIAVDDFGAGHSNFDRIWNIQPDIVKIDRSTIVRAEESRRVRRMLPRMVSLLKESGAIVLVEGVETAYQAAMAMDAEVDLAQGFYFARPQLSLAGSFQLDPQFQDAARLEKKLRAADTAYLRSLGHMFGQVLGYIGNGISPTFAAAALADHDAAIRLYLLDEKGVQVADNVMLAGAVAHDHRHRYKPLLVSKGACWANKEYFRVAIAKPGEVHVSKPYLSLPDGKTCLTFSSAIDTSEGRRVVCLDVLDE